MSAATRFLICRHRFYQFIVLWKLYTYQNYLPLRIQFGRKYSTVKIKKSRKGVSWWRTWDSLSNVSHQWLKSPCFLDLYGTSKNSKCKPAFFVARILLTSEKTIRKEFTFYQIYFKSNKTSNIYWFIGKWKLRTYQIYVSKYTILKILIHFLLIIHKITYYSVGYEKIKNQDISNKFWMGFFRGSNYHWLIVTLVFLDFSKLDMIYFFL